MGPSQFGSRARLGTSDAMQCLLRWREHAHSLGHFTTLISADIEGGFDKVDPRTLGDTDLDPRYVPWIRNWAANRTMRFLRNNRLDPKTYTANPGIPQGSPLSPFLFGAYVTKLTRHRLLANPDFTRIIIPYVDDVIICLSASSTTALETLAKDTWSSLVSEASHIGMSFAENKPRTLHDCACSWGIGSSVKQLRFLGYWLETPPPSSRTAPPSFAYHLSHWITKANLAFNILRAVSLRSSTGLRCTPILRILDACTQSSLLYGLEFWGLDEDLIRRADAFIYGALCNLFDLPIATPHRAISSGYPALPVSIRFKQITRRIAARQLVFDPLEWLDLHLSHGQLRLSIRGSLDSTFGDTLLPWSLPPPLYPRMMFLLFFREFLVTLFVKTYL